MSELIEKAKDMINDFVSQKGIDPAQVFNPEKMLWSLKRGSANVQIMLLTVPVGEGKTREFIQAASPIMKVPQGKETAFYKKLLELNDVNLGVKLSMQKDTDQVWALYERDLVGMDYSELITVLEDLGYWADQFDDMLKAEFE